MRPHPFAWLLGAALVLALAYLLSVAGWMAWHGEAFRRIELPGGAGLERDTQELDAAAEEFGEFQASTIDRLDAVESTIERLNARVDDIEGRSGTPDSRVE